MDGYAVARGRHRDASVAAHASSGTVTAGAMPSRDVGAGRRCGSSPVRRCPPAPTPSCRRKTPRRPTATSPSRPPSRAGAYVRPRGEDLRVGDAVLAPGRGARSGGDRAARDARRTARCSCIAGRAWRSSPRGTSSPSSDASRDRARSRTRTSYSLFAQVLEAGGEPMNLGIAADRARRRSRSACAGASRRGRPPLVGRRLRRRSRPREDRAHARGRRAASVAGLDAAGQADHVRLARRHAPSSACRAIPCPRWSRSSCSCVPRSVASRASRHSIDCDCAPARSTPIDNPGYRRGYLRVTLERDGTAWGARLTGDQGSAILTSMVRADGLAVVPGDTTIAAWG